MTLLAALLAVLPAGCGAGASGSAPIGAGATQPPASTSVAAAVPAGSDDDGGAAACDGVKRLVTSGLTGVTEKDLLAVEAAAATSTAPVVVDAGKALGRAREVWVRDSARFTEPDDQMLVQAGLSNALFTMAEVCGKAGLLRP